MPDSRVVVLDPHEGRELGLQVKLILERERNYRVELFATFQILESDDSPIAPGLIIPVLSESKHSAQMLSELSKTELKAPILSVVRLNELQEVARLFPRLNDFLLTPLRDAEVRMRVARLIGRDDDWNRAKDKGSFDLDQLLGRDPLFAEVKRRIGMAARFESPVLITGETGTGKEMCARALHYLSRRVGKPFLPVNCGAIPLELFESELFGHQKGAFTSAWTAQAGLIAEAEGGTLFLDEIETLSLPAQAKLLRFVQDQSYYVVGSPRPRRANVWIIASSNVDLSREVREGTFREDLFYRLAVITLALPPLRQRPLDIPLLALHFLRQYAKNPESANRRLSPRAIEALSQYGWPGNVRQLENVMRQLVMFATGDQIELEQLPIPVNVDLRGTAQSSFKAAKAAAIKEFETAYIAELLRIHQGNVSHAAKAAQKERRAFARLVKKHQICLR